MKKTIRVLTSLLVLVAMLSSMVITAAAVTVENTRQGAKLMSPMAI